MFSKIMSIMHAISEETESLAQNVMLRMDPAGVEFVRKLRSLKLMEPEMEAELLNRLLLSASQVISVDEVRRVASVVIFERQFDSPEDDFVIYDEQWRLLFN